jgi:hypothetical protein
MVRRKETLLLLAILSSVEPLAHADPSQYPVYEAQEAELNRFLDTHLPAARTGEDPWNRVWEGQTPDGAPCTVIRPRGILLKDHPDLSEVEKTYGDYRFNWEPSDLSMDVIGFPINPQFSATATSLTASATVPSGFFTSHRYGLKLKVEGDILSVKIRNIRKLLPVFQECLFRK